jgi:hypothetical protein
MQRDRLSDAQRAVDGRRRSYCEQCVSHLFDFYRHFSSIYREYSIVYEDGISLLTIQQVVQEDEGEYVCEAVNAVGRATTKCFLTIGRIKCVSL